MVRLVSTSRRGIGQKAPRWLAPLIRHEPYNARYLIAPSIPASALSLPDASFAPLICHYCISPTLSDSVVHTRLACLVGMCCCCSQLSLSRYPSSSHLSPLPAVLDKQLLTYLPTCPLLPLPATYYYYYSGTALHLHYYITSITLSNRRARASHSARTGRCIGVKHPLTIPSSRSTPRAAKITDVVYLQRLLSHHSPYA